MCLWCHCRFINQNKVLVLRWTLNVLQSIQLLLVVWITMMRWFVNLLKRLVQVGLVHNLMFHMPWRSCAWLLVQILNWVSSEQRLFINSYLWGKVLIIVKILNPRIQLSLFLVEFICCERSSPWSIKFFVIKFINGFLWKLGISLFGAVCRFQKSRSCRDTLDFILLAILNLLAILIASHWFSDQNTV